MTANVTRRDFVGIGAGTVGAAVTAWAGIPKAEADEPVGETGWLGTPENIMALGGSTMPLEELNRRRRAYVDAQTDYTRADGTVIPAVFVKVRALIHTYGVGCGNTLNDDIFDGILEAFSEDDAQAFLDMPWGEEFIPYDLYAATGRPLDECMEICNRLADAGFLCRVERANGPTFHQVPYFQGVVEYHFTEFVAQQGYNLGIVGADMNNDTRDSGSPQLYAIPCSRDVVGDSSILPYDDVEEIIKCKNKLAIAPCMCRYNGLVQAGYTDIPTWDDFASGEFEDYFSPLNNQRVETCLMLGDEAEYWISQGIAREISQEDALRYMKRSADDGFILQGIFSKDTETICSCHIDSCGVLSMWSAVGDADDQASAKAFAQISHYVLEVDYDSCIKCGSCEERCPLHAITMDEETGYPVVAANCFRCGQCAYVCPQEARKLYARPEEENLELPRSLREDANMKAAYRFEHNLIS